jgi:hypothetical protein
MKRETLFLKVVVFLIGIPIFVLCIFVLPWIANKAGGTMFAEWLFPALIGMYISAVPFYFALYQAFRLLGYIDKNKAFSELSVRALKNIKYCALAISILYVLVMPFFFRIADADDAPGLVLIGLIIIFASFVVAAFAAVLQKLLKNAIDIKAENDLTI